LISHGFGAEHLENERERPFRCGSGFGSATSCLIGEALANHALQRTWRALSGEANPHRPVGFAKYFATPRNPFINHKPGNFGPSVREGGMNGAEVLDVGRDAIWLTLQLCAPILIVGLVVGVVIGLFQALTQIQEATLVYAPKILAVFVTLLLTLPLMGALMGGFMRHIAERISGM
jgi:flagellar biosynthetic protein FliQ